MSASKSPKSNLIRGAFWTVGTRWIARVMGFINTLVMARLLVPEDYGIVAMGMLVVGLIQTFLDFSPTLALMRKNQVTREEIDSAWTLRLIQGCSAGAFITLCAPLAATYFKEPRLLEILWVFAACVILASASNLAQTLALKEFNYTLDFKISIIGKLVSVITTIGFGLFLRDYRALVLGIVAGYLTPFLLSYNLHKYRPRWNTSKISEIWKLTKWILVSNVVGFLLRKTDEFIAGRIGSTAEFGIYNVGSDLGQLPVSEVGPAMQRAILPVLASIQDNVDRTKQAVLKTLSAINTVIWPIGLGFAALSLEATELILGSKWIDASPYVAVFAIIATLQSSGGPLRSYLALIGHTKVLSNITWLEFCSFALLAVALISNYHLVGLAYARMISSLFSSIYLVVATKKYGNFEYSKIISNYIRPISTSVAMFFLVSALINTIDSNHLKLIAGISFGAVFYILITALTWQLSGRPEGFESTIFDNGLRFRKRN